MTRTAKEREAMRRRSAIVQGLDDWAEAHVGERAPSPTRMSAKFAAYMADELGRPVTHSIEVPGHRCQFANGADAARELAFYLLCESKKQYPLPDEEAPSPTSRTTKHLP